MLKNSFAKINKDEWVKIWYDDNNDGTFKCNKCPDNQKNRYKSNSGHGNLKTHLSSKHHQEWTQYCNDIIRFDRCRKKCSGVLSYR